MESLSLRLDRWKIILIVIGIFVIIFLSVFYYTPKLQQTPNSYSPDFVSTVTPSIPDVKKEEVKNSSWNIYKSQNYQIEYPVGWEKQISEYAGGNSLVIKPNYLTGENNFPALLIEYFSDNSKFSEAQNIYLNLNFNKVDAVIDNNSAVKLTGTIPVNNIFVRKTLLFVKHSDSMYLIAYQYEGEKINEQFESVFSSMLSTFKFNQ